MSAASGGLGMKQIDRNSPLPYYYQLADILRDEIDNERWDVDQLIPSEGALIKMFGVSRSVTRKSLELLENEGRVLRIKGKGTIVVRPKFTYEGDNAAGQWFSRRARTVRLGSVLSAGRVSCGGNLGKVLGISPREDVWEIVFTHTIDQQPVSVSQMYLLMRGTLTVSAPPEFEPGGHDIMAQLATRYGVDIVASQMEVEVSQATGFESESLPGSEGSLLVRINSLDSTENRTVGFTRTAIRPQHFFLAIDMNRRSDTAGQNPLAGGLLKAVAAQVRRRPLEQSG